MTKAHSGARLSAVQVHPRNGVSVASITFINIRGRQQQEKVIRHLDRKSSQRQEHRLLQSIEIQLFHGLQADVPWDEDVHSGHHQQQARVER